MLTVTRYALRHEGLSPAQVKQFMHVVRRAYIRQLIADLRAFGEVTRERPTAPRAADFVGHYVDPRNPTGWRQITLEDAPQPAGTTTGVMDDEGAPALPQLRIEGVDEPGDERWRVPGHVLGERLMVDYSSRGGAQRCGLNPTPL